MKPQSMVGDAAKDSPSLVSPDPNTRKENSRKSKKDKPKKAKDKKAAGGSSEMTKLDELLKSNYHSSRLLL